MNRRNRTSQDGTGPTRATARGKTLLAVGCIGAALASSACKPRSNLGTLKSGDYEDASRFGDESVQPGTGFFYSQHRQAGENPCVMIKAQTQIKPSPVPKRNSNSDVGPGLQLYGGDAESGSAGVTDQWQPDESNLLLSALENISTDNPVGLEFADDGSGGLGLTGQTATPDPQADNGLQLGTYYVLDLHEDKASAERDLSKTLAGQLDSDWGKIQANLGPSNNQGSTSDIAVVTIKLRVVKSISPDPATAPLFYLEPAAAASLQSKDPGAFTQNCGDSFVASVVQGGTLEGYAIFRDQNQTHKRGWTGKFMGGVSKKFGWANSAQLQLDFQKLTSATSGFTNVAIHVSQRGMAVPENPTDLKTLLAAIEKSSAATQSTALLYRLRSYRSAGLLAATNGGDRVLSANDFPSGVSVPPPPPWQLMEGGRPLLYDTATHDCGELAQNGEGTWHLATRVELNQLDKSSADYAKLAQQLSLNTQNGYGAVWTSSPSETNPAYKAIYIPMQHNFNGADQIMGDSNQEFGASAICVLDQAG